VKIINLEGTGWRVLESIIAFILRQGLWSLGIVCVFEGLAGMEAGTKVGCLTSVIKSLRFIRSVGEELRHFLVIAISWSGVSRDAKK